MVSARAAHRRRGACACGAAVGGGAALTTPTPCRGPPAVAGSPATQPLLPWSHLPPLAVFALADDLLGGAAVQSAGDRIGVPGPDRTLMISAFTFMLAASAFVGAGVIVGGIVVAVDVGTGVAVGAWVGVAVGGIAVAVGSGVAVGCDVAVGGSPSRSAALWLLWRARLWQ